MPTVLHLIDSSSPSTCPTTLALIAESMETNASNKKNEALLIGGEDIAHAASNCNLAGSGRLGVPFGKPVLGLPALYNRIKNYPDIKLFHCWSLGSLLASALLFPKVPKLLSLTNSLLPAEIKKLKKILTRQQRRTHITTFTDNHKNELINQGINAKIISTLSPAINLKKYTLPEKNTTKQQLGIDENTPLIALLSDPPQAGDCRFATLAVGLAGEALGLDENSFDKKAPASTSFSRASTHLFPHLLTCPKQYRGQAARQMIKKFGKQSILIQNPNLAYPWKILPACDMAIYSANQNISLSLLWAIALGIPTCASIDLKDCKNGFLEDKQTCLLSKPGDQRALASSIENILQNPELAKHLQKTAKSKLNSCFNLETYKSKLNKQYSSLLAPKWIITNEPAPETKEKNQQASV